MVGIIPVLLLLATSCVTAFAFQDFLRQFYIGWLLVLVLWIMRLSGMTERPWGRLFFLTTALLLSLRYWFFRTFDTLVYEAPFDFAAMLALYGAETYSIAVHVLGVFVNLMPLKRSSPPLPADPDRLPVVDVFIPTYNEPVDIARATLAGCSLLEYPRHKLNVYLLDDGGTDQKVNDPDPVKAAEARARRRELRAAAADFGARYLTRDRNSHAKAGNINTALASTDPASGYVYSGSSGRRDARAGDLPPPGELVLVLDCDHVPTRDILRRTVGFFLEDEAVFLVQTPHFFINPNPIERNLRVHHQTPSESDLFFGAVLPGLDSWGSAYFCGSAALLRRRHLYLSGGISRDTITEDAETALALHAKGLKSVYLNEPMICGLSPETFGDFILQRSRWAQGMVQILLLKRPFLDRGLTWQQKLCYLNSCLYWFFGFVQAVFYAAPLCYILFGMRIYNATYQQILAFSFPHVAAILMASGVLFGRVRHPFFSELYATIQSIFMIPAIISTLLNPRKPSFRVTPKGQNLKEDFVSPIAWPLYLMFFVCLAAFPLSLFRWLAYPMERWTIGICLIWSLFNFVMLTLCLGVVWEARQWRRHHRIEAAGRVWLTAEAEDGAEREGSLTDVSLEGMGARAPADLPLERGDVVRIRSVDAEGRVYRLRARVARAARSDAEVRLGLNFILDTPAAFAQAVGFVYGDSRRWAAVLEEKRLAKRGLLRSFLYLLRVGVTGVARNFRGILWITTRELFRYARGLAPALGASAAPVRTRS